MNGWEQSFSTFDYINLSGFWGTWEHKAICYLKYTSHIALREGAANESFCELCHGRIINLQIWDLPGMWIILEISAFKHSQLSYHFTCNLFQISSAKLFLSCWLFNNSTCLVWLSFPNPFCASVPAWNLHYSSHMREGYSLQHVQYNNIYPPISSKMKIGWYDYQLLTNDSFC